MFRRILVPVDFTPRSLRAVRAAARVAAGAKGDVTLLHVIERIDGGETTPSLRDFYEKLEANALPKMEAFRKELGRKEVPARAEIVYGNRVAAILDFAHRTRADLIVMSSHKLPLRHPGESWGTISYKVGLLSRCPVLLVK